MNYENVLYQREKRIALMTLNRPPANSINLATLKDIEQVLDRVETDKDVRVFIITGAGDKGFSAGFDVSDAANSYEACVKAQELWTRIDCFPKPVIAAINGYAFGGGCELAMAATFRAMLASARVGLTELNLGVIPTWGGTQWMPRIVGKAKALELILFSKRISAQEAFEIGLVEKISKEGELMKDVMEMADALALRPPLAVKAALQAVNAGLEKGLHEGMSAELQGTRLVSKSKDAMEGFVAFMEKRSPHFKGE